MFSLTRAKYIAALETTEKMAETLIREKENLFFSSQSLSANWFGLQANKNLGMINKSLQIGEHAKALAYTQGMAAIMGEYLPEIEKMMAKREKIGEQLNQDWYTEPDLSSFCKEKLIIDYDYIEDIKADAEGAVQYGDSAIEILEEMIEEVEACAGEYTSLNVARELLTEGKRKLHRIENFRYEFVDFARKMSDMEYNMSLDLSNIIREQGDVDILPDATKEIQINHEARTEQIGESSEVVDESFSDWIHLKMELQGVTPEEQYLNDKLSGLKIPWTQEKVDELWAACIEIKETYGIQIDPRFLLAIIIQEGTGSFNTSSTNLVSDGQNGPEINYSLDLMKANNLVFGKILGYAYYGSEFRKVAMINTDKLNSSTGDMFDYINWNTPIVDLNKQKVRVGVYAGHSAWGGAVEAIYEELTSVGAGENYSEYVAGLDPIIVESIIEDMGFDLPHYTFKVEQNGQNSIGEIDGSWTITIIR